MLDNGKPLSAAYNDDSHQYSCGEQFNEKVKGLIPEVGTIILFNEICKWQDRKIGRTVRGCGIVSAHTQRLVFIDTAIRPGVFVKTSFPKTDFLSGLVRYVVLKDFVYQNRTSYIAMDLNGLSDEIAKLVIEM